MGEGQQERVSVSRREFEEFLSENQDLIERYQRLLDQVKELTQRNKYLEERLRVFEQEKPGPAPEAEGFLTNAGTTIKRLLQEADRRSFD